MVLRQILKYEGAILVLAENGQQALAYLEKAEAAAPDVVIMDVQMPDMDGYKSTRRIRSIAPDIPVIGLTAHAMDEEREHCLTAGMVDHVTKPIDINYLVEVLLQQLPVTDKHENRAIPQKMQPAPMVDRSRQDLLPGFAIASALENLQCDLPAYKQVLLTFYRQRRNNYEEITTSLVRGDIEQARDLLHGIKGSSGYLEARKLHHAAMALEEALGTAAPDRITERLSLFRLSFAEAMDGLGRTEAQGVADHSGRR